MIEEEVHLLGTIIIMTITAQMTMAD